MNDNKITYNVEIDNSGLKKGAEQACRIFEEIGNKAEAEGLRIDRAWENGIRSSEEFVQAILTQKMAIGELEAELQNAKEILDNIAFEEIKIEIGVELSSIESELETSKAAFGDLTTELENLGSKSNVIPELISGFEGLSATVEAGNGILSLFGKESERLAAIQSKLQAVTTVLNNVQKVSNTLHGDGATKIGLIQRAKELLAAASGRLAVALGISTVAAHALMAALTVGLSVAIGLVIALFEKFSSEQAKARKEFENFSNKVGDLTGPVVADFKRMESQWNDLGDSLEDKQKYIEENQEAFENLGIKINDVANAERLFENGGEAFIKSVQLRAQAAAAMELAAEKYKEGIRKMMEADEMSATKTYYISQGMFSGLHAYEGENKEKQERQEEAQDAMNKGNDFIQKSLEFNKESNATLVNAGLQSSDAIVKGSIADLEKSISNQRKALKNISDPEEYRKAQKAIEDEQKKIDRITGNSKGKTEKPKEKTKNTLSEQGLQAQQRIEDQRIALIEDGYERERAAAKLAFDREIARIAQEEAEKQALYEKLKAEGADVSEQDKRTIIDQAAEQQKLALQLHEKTLEEIKNRENEAQRNAEKEQEAHLNSLLNKYADYNRQRENLEKEFETEIQALKDQRNEQNSAQIDQAIAEATKRQTAAIAELDATVQDSTSLWSGLFDQFGELTNRELKAIIQNAQEVLDYINSTEDQDIVDKFGLSAEQLRNLKANSEELGAAYDKLFEKTQQFNNGNPFSALVKNSKSLKKTTEDLGKARKELTEAEASGNKKAIKAAQENVKRLESQEKLLKKDLKDAAFEAVGYLGDVGSSLQQIGEASGNSALASFGKTLSEVTDIAKQFASGDYIGATISTITTGLTAIFSSRAKYKAALRQTRKDREAFEFEYMLAMSNIRLEGKGHINIFGEDTFRKAIDGLKEVQFRYDQFTDRVNKKDTLNFGDSIFGQMKAAQKKAMGITTDLENTWIQTRHKTLFRKAKGFYLKDKYPELFEGEQYEELGINVEAARVLLATNNQLNEEAKKQLEEVVKLYDEWQEAEEQFKSYLSNTFGEIGGGLGDAIIDAFKDGTDAMENWSKSFENVLENLGKQLMQTLFFQKHFDQLEKDLTGIYERYDSDPDALAQNVQSLLGGFFSGMEGQVEAAQKWYEAYAENAKKFGFNLYGDIEKEEEQREATAKGFATMSQQSADELNGRFTAMQALMMETRDTTFSINEGTKILTGNSNAILNQVTLIRENTDNLHSMAKDLAQIRADQVSLRSSVNNMELKGIILQK